MANSIGLGGWWRRIRLAGWKTWRILWRPDDEGEEEEKEEEGGDG